MFCKNSDQGINGRRFKCDTTAFQKFNTYLCVYMFIGDLNNLIMNKYASIFPLKSDFFSLQFLQIEDEVDILD